MTKYQQYFFEAIRSPLSFAPCLAVPSDLCRNARACRHSINAAVHHDCPSNTGILPPYFPICRTDSRYLGTTGETGRGCGAGTGVRFLGGLKLPVGTRVRCTTTSYKSSSLYPLLSREAGSLACAKPPPWALLPAFAPEAPDLARYVAFL